MRVELAVTGIAPSDEERHFADVVKRGRLRLVAAPDGAARAVTIRQDARRYVGLFDGDESAEPALERERRAYVHVARGAITVNGNTLAAGDAAMICAEPGVVLRAGKAAELLVFDLP
jgi:hypothetical protein